MSLKILCSGYLVRSPLGGLSWHHLQYLVGLQRLGHDVTFLEHFGWPDSCFDPSTGCMTSDPSYGIKHLNTLLEPFGLQDKWCYLAEDGMAHGMPRAQLERICREADLYLNLSNINWIPELEECRRRVLIDTDPVFTQIGAHGIESAFDRYQVCFTYGENVHLTDCTMPTAGTTWRPTRQPIVLELWEPTAFGRAAGPFTTVANWRPFRSKSSEEGRYGQKDRQFKPYFRLPRETGYEMELAMNPPDPARRLLIEGGWRVADPSRVAGTPQAYQQYLRDSRAEFSVAKHAYVSTQCGWFSERTACYLASGVPVVVEDTGFPSWMETGIGVVPFRNRDEAAAALDKITRSYGAHRQAAREIASEYFEASRVLSKLLSDAVN